MSPLKKYFSILLKHEAMTKHVACVSPHAVNVLTCLSLLCANKLEFCASSLVEERDL